MSDTVWPAVPASRVRDVNGKPVQAGREFVLYWCIANRRSGWNFSLERAVEWATELDRPLVVLEPLRVGYRWASDRLHAFVIDGMRDNARAYDRAGVTYYPYLEPEPGAGRGLLAALAARASVIVTDDFPCFFLPRMVESAGRQVDTRLEAVDGNGLFPMRSTDQVFSTAYAFRRHLQRTLSTYLGEFPAVEPLKRLSASRPYRVDETVRARWVPADLTRTTTRIVSKLPIDHDVPAAAARGGSEAGSRLVSAFVSGHLPAYAEERNHPDRQGTSGLSPFLHFGHVSAHQVFEAVAEQYAWSPLALATTATGGRRGWWGMSESAEAFLDQIVTWRELGFNMCAHRPDYDQYDSLPEWARRTLSVHAGDPRAYRYDLAVFEEARTHDPLWNAAQTELRREGGMHNYLRMLWGKKILEWTASPPEALDVMVELNNKFGLDGRNPNSYSGIFWTLGRYDRPWGPERPIFGTVRYMSSANTSRKLRVREYLARFGPPAKQLELSHDIS